jgi:hypothetical protein
MQFGVFMLKMNPKGREFESPSGQQIIFPSKSKSQNQCWHLKNQQFLTQNDIGKSMTIFIEISVMVTESVFSVNPRINVFVL